MPEHCGDCAQSRQGSRANPECRHLTGDRRSLRSGERSDAAAVFDAISHLTTEADLLATLRTVRVHLAPDGAGILPRETWTRLLKAAGFGQVVVAAQSGRNLSRAIAA